MSKLVFKEKDIMDYQDKENCFGKKNIPGEQMGYDPEEPVCIDCPSLQKCKLLIDTDGKAPEFLEALSKFTNEPTEEPTEIPSEEPSEEPTEIPTTTSQNVQEITREQVRIEAEEVVKAFDPSLKFTYKSLQNRDKIYVDGIEFFDTTKSTLKFCRIKDGAEIHLTPEEYGDSHTGISVNYELGLEKLSKTMEVYMLKQLGKKPVEENITEIEPEIQKESRLEGKTKNFESAYSMNSKVVTAEEYVKEDQSIMDSQEEIVHSIVEYPMETENKLRDISVDFEVPHINALITGTCYIGELAKVFSKIKEAAEKLSN